MQEDANCASVKDTHRSPGTEGIWIFVFIDMIIFLLIFFTFMTERMAHVDLYKTSQRHLNEIFGLANTLILLTSSWMVVEATHAARKRNPDKVSAYLASAFALGLVFSINKIVEYHLKFDSGITPVTNSFFTFYFFITIVHFLHVIAGMILLFLFGRNAPACLTSTRYQSNLENVGLFWHYVDILWIFIFPLLYLVGR